MPNPYDYEAEKHPKTFEESVDELRRIVGDSPLVEIVYTPEDHAYFDKLGETQGD